MPKLDERDPMRVRNSYKGQLTVFSSYLSNLKQDEITQLDASELELRLGKFKNMYERFDEVQLNLECSCEGDALSSQLKERSEFDSLYFKLISKAEQILRKFNNSEKCETAQSYISNSHNIVKLPTIQLPKFSGSYENWLEFHDTFSSLIHQNNDIDDINKYHYLRASLEGSAAVVIRSIEFSASNYSVAWKLLCDRFDNKRLLIQNHVSALFNLENITKECSVTLKRFIDQINKNLRSLESLGEPISEWDTLIIYIFTQKLDTKTYREWEEYKGRLDKNDKIKLDCFLIFLRNRSDLVETLEMSRNLGNKSNQNTKNNSNNQNNNQTKIKTMVSVQTSQKLCPNCNGEHCLSNCSQFLSLSNDARLKLLPNFKVCYNCFSTGHFANRCKKKGCKVCQRKHNTLVHVAEFKSRKTESGSSLSSNPDSVSSATGPPHPATDTARDVSVALSASVSSSDQRDVLLSTALVKVYDSNNKEHIARAILDSGSTSCLMSETLYNQLNLRTIHVNQSVIGINNISSQLNKMCRLTIKSLNETYSSNVQCFILPSITDNVPSCQVNLTNINIPKDICLADPHFHTPAAIDIILGADVFWDILGSQKILLRKGGPTLFETRLGWLVSGPTELKNSSNLPKSIQCHFTKVDSSSNDFLNANAQCDLTRFWRLEEVDYPLSHYSKEEKSCEEHFVNNTTRMADGRFCVKIPLKKSPELLGDSLNRATKCFLSLERRFETQSTLGSLYKDFMSEYESLGHMTPCSLNNPEKPCHFIPHHGVLRESSVTTKLRAVFNASSPTTTGVTYNDLQMVGPVVQDDLLSILLRFRQHRYIVAADVEKMYRQVLVHPDFRHLQQIIWRSDPAANLKAYQLNTVTYGTASAPFLATRCLQQVGLESKDDKIKEIITHDFYVDDLLTGGNTIEEVLYIRDQVSAELASACMPLRKWKSNHSSLIESDESSVAVNIGAKEPSKTLGLSWQTNVDVLCFPIGDNVKQSNTKRDMLSVIAQIFDPLGLLSPYIIKMKMLLQQLWLNKLSWDEPLPDIISVAWREILDGLPHLNKIKVPRCVIHDDDVQRIELHIFSDASEKAYGACVYVRSVSQTGSVLVRLLMAKSRVAPLKPTTIPRLELCGALVGTRLYKKASDSLRLKVQSVVFWTDSTIVLGWLKMMPNKLQPFVRNRVAEIVEATGNHVWRHVPTTQNPADFISRGVNIISLETLDLWWSGPSFLQDDNSRWPSQVKTVSCLPETRGEVSLHTTLKSNDVPSDDSLIDFSRFSSFLRLKRTVAFVLRFVKSCKKETSVSGSFSEEELTQAMNVIIALSQKQSFPEYTLFLQNKPLPKKSHLHKFHPFMDKNNIMRVGGRLNNSNFAYDKKHPILLQSTHRFTKLLFEFEHKNLMHAGPQLLLYSIRESYWPIGGKRLAKATYRQCVRCVRMRGSTVKPLMGNLPFQRVNPSFPFLNVGVDYAGPIMSASRQGRGCRLVKVYIVVFVCFSTKAIHLELVGDLTSNNYLLALRRFMSRRGKPHNLYSDNGTSFVGAHNELSKFLKENSSSLADDIANEGIAFHFIPAYSPHFGGLWEAGVKSTKFHLLRVLGHCNLTYEELNSTLIQIEAILNSRPLTPMSSDPEDLMPLTPGHFLIGRTLTSLPSRDYSNHSTNHLTRYQRIEQLRQHFWARWYKEYISELQQRTKWRHNTDTLKADSLVIIKEDNLPPLKWKLGRIVKLFPGTDGISRVADVKTANGVIRRSFARICPLPDLTSVESHAFNAGGHV